MEYKDINEFLTDNQLDESSLVGKNILYLHIASNLEEYVVLEIVPWKNEHRKMLLKSKVLVKLRNIESGKQAWFHIDIKNIKFVKIEEAKKEQDKEKINDDKNESLRKLIEAGKVYEKYKRIPCPKQPIVDYPIPNRPQTIPYPPNYPIICSACGLNCEGTMGYCCPNHHCPMGMGPMLCKTSTDAPQSTTIPVIQSTCVSQNTIDDPVDFNRIG